MASKLLSSFTHPAGRVPFKSDSILGLYDEIRNAPLVFPEDVFVSESLKRLLSGLLEKDPESRMSLTGAMYHQWTTHNGAYPLPNIQVHLLSPISGAGKLASISPFLSLSSHFEVKFMTVYSIWRLPRLAAV